MPTETDIMAMLEEVTDPEIPVLNVVEMGIVRRAERREGREGGEGGEGGEGHERREGNGFRVIITPTYSGCPAMNAIEQAILQKMEEKGVHPVEVVTDHRDPWTTDWMTEDAKRKLKEYGIAPPPPSDDDSEFLSALKSTQKIVPCPFCDSLETELQSEFGSTACKSLYYCNGCSQPFEHFKCI